MGGGCSGPCSKRGPSSPASSPKPHSPTRPRKQTGVPVEGKEEQAKPWLYFTALFSPDLTGAGDCSPCLSFQTAKSAAFCREKRNASARSAAAGPSELSPRGPGGQVAELSGCAWRARARDPGCSRSCPAPKGTAEVKAHRCKGALLLSAALPESHFSLPVSPT